MGTDAKNRLQEIAASVAATLLVSVIGGGFGVYVGYRLLEQRVHVINEKYEKLTATVEKYKAETDAARDRLNDRLEDIRRDVSYIRGTLERNGK